jgi:hypothetical protein
MNGIDITEPNNAYDFKNINIGSLTRISGETFQARIFSNGKPLFVQTPKSITKQGFIKTGKKLYCDLMFTNQDELFVNWIENLETTCQRLIYEKKTEWFTEEDKMDLHDIESAFTSLLKLYKSGKYYLIRANIKQNIKIFDEQGGQLATERVDATTYMITVLEIQSIKFASKNFQIEVEMKQCMVVSPDPFSESCFIKHSAMKPSSANASPYIKAISNTNDALQNTEIISSLIDEIADEPESIEALGEMELKLELKMESNADGTKSDKSDKGGKGNKGNNDDDNELFIEDDTTKLNTELNSIMKSEIQRKPSLGDDDDDDDEGVGNIHIHGDLIDSQSLGIIEISKDTEPAEINLKEIELHADDSLETISLKKPNQVYYEIYKNARKKAKDIKREAVAAYLDAKNIKKTYMLDDMEDTDSDFDEMSVNESDGE